jgi:L-ascorbate metabolism protein UlaG (beta-lactamase superfamily)
MGHASFLLETQKGTKIITDPYEPGSYSGAVGYSPIGVEADIVTVSHQHADHNYIKEFSTAEIIDKAGNFTVGDVQIQGLLSYHDQQKGKERGEIIIFIISADGLRIAHFSDLGTMDIDLDKLKNIDIALIPVGGTFTIDAKEATKLLSQINPKITIPMHFKTPKLGFDLLGVDTFLSGKANIEKKDSLQITRQDIDSLQQEGNVVVLDYQR